ncbi:hypothetical protein P3T23_004189 [Paraburkholderia sp. GAS448]
MDANLSGLTVFERIRRCIESGLAFSFLRA